MSYETNVRTKHTQIISVGTLSKFQVFLGWRDVETDRQMWRRKIISRWFLQSYRRLYMMWKARGKEEAFGILASSNSSSLVDTFLGRLLLFPFPIVEELVKYTISSVSTLPMMLSSQWTIKLSLVSHRPVLSRIDRFCQKTIHFAFLNLTLLHITDVVYLCIALYHFFNR